MLGWIVLALMACSPSAPPPAEAPPPAPVAEAPPGDQDWKVLQASPLSLEAQVRAAGVADTLGDLVPTALPAMPPPDDKDRVAFRTGVVFAYTVLGGAAVEKTALVANVRSMREGMATLGTGAGLLATMDQAIVQLENDTASRQDFLEQLDDEVSSAPAEEGWGPGDTTGPMVQAGAWLAGTHLVAQAVVRKNDPTAAAKLLRRPEVPAYFLKYLRTAAGSEKAGSAKDKVSETLVGLEQLSAKPEITLADAQAIVDSTGSLLQLF
jgi:hypothetical protein